MALALALMVAAAALAQVPEAPNPPRLVNDFAGIIGVEQAAAMEKTLEDFTRETSNRIVVVTMDDLGKFTPMEMATAIGSKWGVGDKEKRNGVVVLVKPKTETKGQVFISVGYGLEGAIPDALCSKIIRYEMMPLFKANDYASGLTAGLTVLMEAAKGEYNDRLTPEEEAVRTRTKLAGLLMAVIILVVIYVIWSKRRDDDDDEDGGRKMRRRMLAYWLIFGSDFGGGSGGDSGHSGGGFGGGFGGFGGGFGGFGGGGAGGSW